MNFDEPVSRQEETARRNQIQIDMELDTGETYREWIGSFVRKIEE